MIQRYKSYHKSGFSKYYIHIWNFRAKKSSFWDIWNSIYEWVQKGIPYIPDSLQNQAETVGCLALVLKHFQTEFAAENLILNRYYSWLQDIENHKSIENFILVLAPQISGNIRGVKFMKNRGSNNGFLLYWTYRFLRTVTLHRK